MNKVLVILGGVSLIALSACSGGVGQVDNSVDTEVSQQGSEIGTTDVVENKEEEAESVIASSEHLRVDENQVFYIDQDGNETEVLYRAQEILDALPVELGDLKQALVSGSGRFVSVETDQGAGTGFMVFDSQDGVVRPVGTHAGVLSWDGDLLQLENATEEGGEVYRSVSADTPWVLALAQ